MYEKKKLSNKKKMWRKHVRTYPSVSKNGIYNMKMNANRYRMSILIWAWYRNTDSRFSVQEWLYVCAFFFFFNFFFVLFCYSLSDHGLASVHLTCRKTKNRRKKLQQQQQRHSHILSIKYMYSTYCELEFRKCCYLHILTLRSSIKIYFMQEFMWSMKSTNGKNKKQTEKIYTHLFVFMYDRVVGRGKL